MGSGDQHGILPRFHEEQGYIKQYVEYLMRQAVVRGEQVRDMHWTLQRLGYQPLRIDWGNGARLRDLSQDEVRQATESYSQFLTDIARAIPAQQELVARLEAQMPQAEVTHSVEVWCEFVDGWFRDGLASTDEGEVVARCLEPKEPEHWDDPEYRMDEGLIRHAIAISKLKWARHRLEGLHSVSSKISEAKLISRMSRGEAEVNVLRQGFILLMQG